jgi:hypothetical protein
MPLFERVCVLIIVSQPNQKNALKNRGNQESFRAISSSHPLSENVSCVVFGHFLIQ